MSYVSLLYPIFLSPSFLHNIRCINCIYISEFLYLQLKALVDLLKHVVETCPPAFDCKHSTEENGWTILTWHTHPNRETTCDVEQDEKMSLGTVSVGSALDRNSVSEDQMDHQSDINDGKASDGSVGNMSGCSGDKGSGSKSYSASIPVDTSSHGQVSKEHPTTKFDIKSCCH